MRAKIDSLEAAEKRTALEKESQCQKLLDIDIKNKSLVEELEEIKYKRDGLLTEIKER